LCETKIYLFLADNDLLTEERKRYEGISQLLEETRLQFQNEIKQSKEKILQIEINLKEKFEQEKRFYKIKFKIKRNKLKLRFQNL